ncbi:MAG: MATE family efflux transporter [Evtepia sp.]
MGSSYTLMTFLTSILLGLCMGSSVFFAMQFGRKDPARFRAGIFQSFCLIGGLTVVLTGLVYLALGGILWFLRIPADVWDLTRTYLVWVFAGIPPTFLYNYFANLLRAIGDSVTPLLFLGVSVVGNIGLDLLFVIPLQMGVMGAALATVLAQYAAGVEPGPVDLATLPGPAGGQGRPAVGPEYFAAALEPSRSSPACNSR